MRAAKKPRRAEERTVFLLLRGDKLAVRRRPDTGLLAKLIEFPNVTGNLDEASAAVALAQMGVRASNLTACGTAKHIFTHLEWQMKGFIATVADAGNGLRCGRRHQGGHGNEHHEDHLRNRPALRNVFH